jgi:hypothetical protein
MVMHIILHVWEMTLIAAVMAVGIIGCLFITTRKAFNKFDHLDISAKDKLLLIDYYMVFSRKFTKDELIKFSELPDEEIKKLNKIHDITERIKTAREMINIKTAYPIPSVKSFII